MENEKKYFAGWWFWMLLLIIAASITFFWLRAGGLIAWTAIEREVFEQSYQRSAAQEAKFNTLNAELIGSESRLRAGSLTDTQRADLEAQIAGLRAQINTMEK